MTDFEKCQLKLRQNAEKMRQEPLALEKLAVILAKWRQEDRERENRSK